MRLNVTFQRAGQDPMGYVARIKTAIKTTVGDMLSVGIAWRTAIIDRTARGIDASGSSFAPYSTRGPYYYTPTSQARGVSAQKQREAVMRLFRKVSRANPLPSGSGAPHPSRTGRSIVFPGGYAQFKAWLGRSNVDLTGPRAPHMMQSLYIRAGGSELSPRAGGAGDNETPANFMTVGIYGEPALRAMGHNNGNPRRGLPQRRFMDVDKDMEAQAISLIEARLHGRLNIE